MKIRESYDRIARRYADRFLRELDHKPLDRMLLDHFAAELRGRGVVADLGCGPGQIARYLHDRGVSAIGVDLSDQMVRLAREAHPGIEFRGGTMLALEAEDGAWAGITAFYAIVHFEPAELPITFREMLRVLRSGGLLLLSFHAGEERVHLDEWEGEPVDIDWRFFPRALVEREIEAAGFAVDAVLERVSYPEEHPTRRVYVLAHKPTQPI